MTERTVQLVLHYDGAAFSGWQRQSSERTVQGVLEDALVRLCREPVAATGAGRTDAGVHARGQAAGVRVAAKWEAAALQRALNAVLPRDVWVESAWEMRPEFHARYSATARRYSYYVGTDAAARSPFRSRWEWSVREPLARDSLDACAAAIQGAHCFRAFAVRGTAPATDSQCCVITHAAWLTRSGGFVLEIEANRFLHRMVRFLVATMIDVARGRRDPDSMRQLLEAPDNSDTSPPAPAHALFLDIVHYPRELYLTRA